MSDYVLSGGLRGFEKKFNRIISVTYKDPLSVFDDFLTYIIGMFNPEPNKSPKMGYKQEHYAMFFDLMREWLEVQEKQTAVRGWYDMFGDFFMEYVGRISQQYRGQFFTPQPVCDFMAKVAIGEKAEETPVNICGRFGRREIVNDSACGSARLLLAAHAVNCAKGKTPGYFVAEDIDRMCCKMAAINLCVHGCFGEVVCHDTIAEPDTVNIGYIINEGLYPFPVCPTIRICEDATNFISTRFRMIKKESPKKESVRKVPEQLTLF